MDLFLFVTFTVAMFWFVMNGFGDDDDLGGLT